MVKWIKEFNHCSHSAIRLLYIFSYYYSPKAVNQSTWMYFHLPAQTQCHQATLTFHLGNHSPLLHLRSCHVRGFQRRLSPLHQLPQWFLQSCPKYEETSTVRTNMAGQAETQQTTLWSKGQSKARRAKHQKTLSDAFRPSSSTLDTNSVWKQGLVTMQL